MGAEQDISSADFFLVVDTPGVEPTTQRRIPFDVVVEAIAARLGAPMNSNNTTGAPTDGD